MDITNIKNADDARKLANMLELERLTKKAAKDRNLEEKKRPFIAKLTITGTIYHSVKDRDSISESYGYDEVLNTEEEWYTRRTKIGIEWVKLETAWVKGASVIYIKNEEIPSKIEEVNPDIDRVMELGILIGNLSEPEDNRSRTMFSPKKKDDRLVTNIIPFTIIKPRKVFLFEPICNPENYYIRSRHDEVRYKIIACPK